MSTKDGRGTSDGGKPDPPLRVGGIRVLCEGGRREDGTSAETANNDVFGGADNTWINMVKEMEVISIFFKKLV